MNCVIFKIFVGIRKGRSNVDPKKQWIKCTKPCHQNGKIIIGRLHSSNDTWPCTRNTSSYRLTQYGV